MGRRCRLVAARVGIFSTKDTKSTKAPRFARRSVSARRRRNRRSLRRFGEGNYWTVAGASARWRDAVGTGGADAARFRLPHFVTGNFRPGDRGWRMRSGSGCRHFLRRHGGARRDASRQKNILPFMCITRLKSEISGKSRRKNSLGLLALRMQAGILAGVLTFRISSRCSSSSLSQQTEGKRHAEQEASAVASGRRLGEADKAVPGLTGRSIAVPPPFPFPHKRERNSKEVPSQSTEHTRHREHKTSVHRTHKQHRKQTPHTQDTQAYLVETSVHKTHKPRGKETLNESWTCGFQRF